MLWNTMVITCIFYSQHINIYYITFPDKDLPQILRRPPMQVYNKWEVNFKQVAYFYFQFSHPLCRSIMFWLLWSWALQEQWIEKCWLPFWLDQKLRQGNLNRIGWPMARWRGLNEVRKSFTELGRITKVRLSRLNPSTIAHVVLLGILWPSPAVKTHFVLLQVSK